MGLKDKIIDVSFKMFSEKGYNQTTIEGIINVVGCSKGGFYHHFKSKEEIINMIIDNYLEELEQYFDQIKLNDSTPIIEQFNKVYEFITDYKIKQSSNWDEISKVFIFKNNQRILKVLERKFKELVINTYGKIIKKGISLGVLKVDYNQIAAEFCTRQILWIYEAASKYYLETEPNESFEELIKFTEDAVSDLLGIKRGKIKFYEKSVAYREVILSYHEEVIQHD